MDGTDTCTVLGAADRLSLNIKPSSSNSAPPAWWCFEVFGWRIYCYNFFWRQQAIAHHDLHHILIGSPFTLLGEMRVATWEYAAGRYRNVFANLFCLPLVVVGCCLIPKAVWSAFRHGRTSRSIFATPITDDLLGLQLREFRARFTHQRPAKPIWIDFGLFAGLVGLSALSITAPIGLVVWLLATSL